VSSWEIKLPFRSEDDWTLEVIDAAREVMDGDELEVTEQIAHDALASGSTKVGELLRELEAAGPAGRRRLLDEAREAVGLLSTTEIEQNQRIAKAARDDPLRPNPPGPLRDKNGRAVQKCAEPDCKTLSPGDGTRPTPVAARKWWCSAHLANAAEGDMDPWTPPPLRFNDSGGFAVSEEEAAAAARHYAQLEERSREQARLRQEQREAERERLEELEKRRRAEIKVPPGLEWAGPPR
jgi:hypothetical protein